MALHTGIAPSVWAEEDQRTIDTVWELLEEQHDAVKDAAKGR